MSGQRTLDGLVFLQGCEARLRALMASLRPLKPLPDILQSLAPSSRGIGWGGRATGVVRTAFVAVDRGEAVDPEKIQGGWSARTGLRRETAAAGRELARARAPAPGVRNF